MNAYLRYAVITEGAETQCLLRTDDHRQALRTARLYAGVSTVRIVDVYDELLGRLGAVVKRLMVNGRSPEKIIELLTGGKK